MKPKRPTLVIAQTTVASRKEARALSAFILEKRLGACVQFTRIQSSYRWRGKIEFANEFLVWIKTRQSLAAKLVELIKQRHSYEQPEIIITPISAAEAGYAKWVLRETK